MWRIFSTKTQYEVPKFELVKMFNRSASAAILYNVKVLCDVAVSRHYNFNLQIMLNQGANAELCTSPAIAQNTCYLPFLLKLA